jgi:hypothetical protein
LGDSDSVSFSRYPLNHTHTFPLENRISFSSPLLETRKPEIDWDPSASEFQDSAPRTPLDGVAYDTHKYAAIAVTVLVIGVLVADTSCDRPREVLAPQAGGPAFRAATSEELFYYYQGQPQYLTIDPRYLVISSDLPSPAAEAKNLLATLGVRVGSDKPLAQAPKHRLLLLDHATRELAERAAQQLRTDSRFTFVSEAYLTVAGSYGFIPVNRLDVLFSPEASPAQIDSVINAFGARVLRPPRPDSGLFAYRVEYPAGRDPLESSRILYRHPLVRWASPDVITNWQIAYEPTDPLFSQQFHLRNSVLRNGIPVDINVVPAWDLTLGSSAVEVAVIDDGIDIEHGGFYEGHYGDLIGPLAGSQGVDMLTPPSYPGEGSFAPCCNDTHGTSVAGLIAATHNNGTGGAGIAPNVTLNSVRIFRKTYPPESQTRDPNNDTATNAEIADGINFAWSAFGSAVINNSWGCGAPSDALTASIQNALTQGRNGYGTVVVFSAGNTALRDPSSPFYTLGFVCYPATLSASTSVISVAAINRDGNPALYSPGTGRIDVVAPSGHGTGACAGWDPERAFSTPS